MIQPSVKFPVYAIEPSVDGFYIAGGGGGSRSGVVNQIAHFKASLSDDNTLAVNYELTSTFDTPKEKGAAMCLAFNQQSNQLACGIDDHCLMFDAGESLKEATQFRTDFFEAQSQYAESYQKVCKFDTDGKVLVTGGTDSAPRLWQVGEYKQLRMLDKVHKDDVNDASFGYLQLDQDKESKVSELVPVVLTCSSDIICLWNVEIGSQLFLYKAEDFGGKFKFAKLFEVDDGLLMVSIRLNQQRQSILTVQNFGNRVLQKERLISKKPVTAFAIFKFQNQILSACGTSDGEVFLLDLKSLKTLWKCQKAHGFSVTALAFGSFTLDKKEKLLLCSGSADCSVRAWEVNELLLLPSAQASVMYVILALLVMLIAIWLGARKLQ